MMLASMLESTGVLLSIVMPLVAVLLTVITFYLRWLREHQVSRHAQLVRQVETIEVAMTDLRKALSEVERDFTSKEEWLRECMHARRTLEQLTEATVRIETSMRSCLSTASGHNTGKRWIRRCLGDRPVTAEDTSRSEDGT